ncbi:cell wall-active antibiotic response 4TMS protein YvqF [Murinocardiopsis flavida]|uniref:Cell wall-active antibiotic response 4TMS protein YvqF n=1 Tax=Murinocardiopsis flavida TaxID=645275 RepID=A0A2P8D593_9ACTN|nr:DUF1707 domain-containing protein [Murinocardiopsis flavida]PSK92362.1 cell wall-active antibiotic response 4TMS protein YvqF [Murinocardiopsis flavida]
MDPDNTLASDAERESAVAQLRDACGEGRITLEELTERVEFAYTARTRAQLSKSVRDLPRPAAPVTPAPADDGFSTNLFALGDNIERKGRWVIDDGLKALAIIGDIKLDLRQAYFSSDTVLVNLRAVLGGVRIWVPEGVRVELDGRAVLGDKLVDIARPRPGAPCLQINAWTLGGSIRIANTRRRIGFFRALLGD